MYSHVTVLVAEDDPDTARLIRRCLEGMSFRVVTTNEIYSGITLSDNADILILDLMLANGESTPLLERWTSKVTKGPALVLSGVIVPGAEDELYIAGAWNVLHKPFKPGALQALMSKYGQYVLMMKEMRVCAEAIKKLQKWVWMLSILVALALGERGLELLKGLIGIFK